MYTLIQFSWMAWVWFFLNVCPHYMCVFVPHIWQSDKSQNSMWFLISLKHSKQLFCAQELCVSRMYVCSSKKSNPWGYLMYGNDFGQCHILVSPNLISFSSFFIQFIQILKSWQNKKVSMFVGMLKNPIIFFWTLVFLSGL